jgi:two-component system, LytTR family, response regulator AlgR
VRILIVDDEPLARQRLRSQLQEIDAGVVVAEADNGISALEEVAAADADIVLLDIRMPGMDGLETARHLTRLPRPPHVIFTTAYDEHALAAFETQALAYLVKPIRTERLREALTRAALIDAGRQSIAQQQPDGLGRRQHVSAMVGGALRLMPLNEVVYFQADQGYVSAVSAQSQLLLEESLRSLEDEFSDRFVRIHRNALVNIEHVAGLHKQSDGNVVVVFKDCPAQLVVSRRLLTGVRKRLRDS